VRSNPETEGNELAMLAEADATIMDDPFLMGVVKPCLDASNLDAALSAFYSIIEHRSHESDMSTVPPTQRWHSSEQDNQLIIALGEISLDIFIRITPSTMPDAALRESHHGRIADHLENLLASMTPNPATNAIYYRVFSLLADADVSVRVRFKIAWLVRRYEDKFGVDLENIRTLIACIQECSIRNELDISDFLVMSIAVLRLSGRLSRYDLRQIRFGVRSVLAMVIHSFSSHYIMSSLHRPESSDWSLMNALLYECIHLVQADANLFELHMIDDLERCITHFRYDFLHANNRAVVHSMRTLRELVEHQPNLAAGSPLVDHGQNIADLASKDLFSSRPVASSDRV